MSTASTAAPRARRRKRAGALRAEGLTTRQIAERLGVSQPTIVRDLGAHREAEGEAVLAVLAGKKPGPVSRPPVRLGRVTMVLVDRDKGKRDRGYRQHIARQLRKDGLTLREIAAHLGVSPATAMRDLRRGA